MIIQLGRKVKCLGDLFKNLSKKESEIQEKPSFPYQPGRTVFFSRLKREDAILFQGGLIRFMLRNFYGTTEGKGGFFACIRREDSAYR